MTEQQHSQNTLAIIKRDTADVVAAKVHQLQQAGELALPQNYAVVNALKSAWLKLQSVETADHQLALMVCSKDSIYNAMLDMVIQGLNPAKNQLYFIAYGKTLVCQRSYFGDEQMVRNIRPDVDIFYQVIYEGDEFEHAIDHGKSRVVKHVQQFKNIDPAKILGAYCVIEDREGRIINGVVMTIGQIRQSWKQSKTYKEQGGNTFHHAQPDQACLRTVIRRCCKPVINSSSDAWLLQAVQREEIAAEAEMEEEATINANGQIIDVEPADAAQESGAAEPTASPAPATQPETPASAPEAVGAPTPAHEAKDAPKPNGQRGATRQQTLGVGETAPAPAAAGPGF